jgi:hypothetical protein
LANYTALTQPHPWTNNITNAEAISSIINHANLLQCFTIHNDSISQPTTNSSAFLSTDSFTKSDTNTNSFSKSNFNFISRPYHHSWILTMAISTANTLAINSES